MNSCELKTIGWNTKKRCSSEVAELIAPSIPDVASFSYITLAKESPNRVLESDEDNYNSFNEQETDICHDSSDISDSDTDSQCSSISQPSLDDGRVDTIATMEVVEYEVASATESEDDYSSDVSSGTEDYMLAAFAQAVADNSSASEFAILADTEESDSQSSYDSDFSPADYWKCVKCNNKQNNPMYRYCERCYQVRKSLFPPRPKQKRKIRSKEELSDSSTSSSSERLLSNISTNIVKLDSSKFHGKNISLSGKISLSRATDSDSGNDIVIEKTVLFQKQLSDTDTEKKSKITQKRKISDDLNCNGFKKRFESQEGLPAKIDSKNQQLQLDVFKDSGFSSSSSQEYTLITEEKLVYGEISSQETIDSIRDDCPIVTNIDNVEILKLKASYPKDKQRYPTLSQVSCLSADSVLFSRKNDTDASVLRESQSSDFSKLISNSEINLGSCMFCLSEPKNSVFVHSNFVHLCCCYKCAMKVWKQRKSCPICNCKVKNVMKLFVH
ncbi:E3 ubiquitin-protein ligase Mdm2 isoform X1 [Aedes aegypti]|uniref:E3 ubiquitin-protein ligase mdm2 n=2 Tax=Aedes aegypti TaxID=7159 RepID=A0A903UV07_AEDAE|nr:E3 ubiquitin-protein ligase Mdm2 isoform X1 [Aedes aegypti]